MAAVGRSLEALLVLHQESLELQPAAFDPNHALYTQAHELLEELDDGGLSEAAFMFNATAIGQDARLQQAQRLVNRGGKDEALPLVQQIVAAETPFAYRRDAVLLLDRLTGQPWLQRAVGVMLPLTGRYATFGDLVRKGMDLALDLQGNSQVRFIYTDVAGSEDAALVVDRLANEERVMAMAGPITGNSAMQAARQAQRQQVPLVSLAQREGVPELGSYVFRNSLTSRLQARALARYAVLDMGYSSFGVLRPQSRQGRISPGFLLKRFWLWVDWLSLRRPILPGPLIFVVRFAC